MTCNPAKCRLVDYLRDGHRYIAGWQVRESYRLRLMQLNDPVLFWISRDKTMGPAGFRGSGAVSERGIGPDHGDEY